MPASFNWSTSCSCRWRRCVWVWGARQTRRGRCKVWAGVVGRAAGPLRERAALPSPPRCVAGQLRRCPPLRMIQHLDRSVVLQTLPSQWGPSSLYLPLPPSHARHGSRTIVVFSGGQLLNGLPRACAASKGTVLPNPRLLAYTFAFTLAPAARRCRCARWRALQSRGPTFFSSRAPRCATQRLSNSWPLPSDGTSSKLVGAAPAAAAARAGAAPAAAAAAREGAGLPGAAVATWLLPLPGTLVAVPGLGCCADREEERVCPVGVG